jgi:hypothetical protein
LNIDGDCHERGFGVLRYLFYFAAKREFDVRVRRICLLWFTVCFVTRQ